MKTKQSLLSALYSLFFVFCLVSCDNPSQDKIVNVDRYVPPGTRISSAAELAKIGVDDNWSLSGDYVLVSDIDLSGYAPWQPIGDNEAPFTGSLNGNGKTIRGLVLGGGERVYTGLFGYITGATIESLTLEIANGKDTPLELSLAGDQYIGVLAAYASGGWIQNIKVKAGGTHGLNSAKTSDAGKHYVGGLIGNSQYSIINNIEVNLPVIASTATVQSEQWVGGVIGYTTSNAIFKQVSVAGSITSASRSKTAHYVGGIAGYTTSTTLENCTSYLTSITVSHDNDATTGDLKVGGLVGDGGPIVKCFVAAPTAIVVNQPNTTGAGIISVGGIKGTTNTVTDCSISAPVTITVTAGRDAILFVGGIAGQASAVTRCSIPAAVSLTVTKTANTKQCNVGGIIGGGGSVTDSYSAANIEVINETQSANNSVGGIGGYFSGSYKVSNCYYSGNITVTGYTTQIGGILGLAYTTNANAGVQNSAVLRSRIAVTENAEGGMLNAERILCKNNELNLSTKNKFLDVVVTKNGEVQTISDDVNGTSGEEINVSLTQDVFNRGLLWDFADVWVWDAKKNLPVLR
jgi:hypothetical protein